MSTVRVTKQTMENYERRLKNKGEVGLFNSVVGQGFNDKAQFNEPEVMILDRSEAFFALYRSTGKEDYFIIGRILRKAAHRLYRQFHRMYTEHPINKRFLNIVKI